MRGVETIEDFFRGARFVSGILFAICLVILSGFSLFVGILMTAMYESPLPLVLFLFVTSALIGVPVGLVRLGQWLRTAE